VRIEFPCANRTQLGQMVKTTRANRPQVGQGFLDAQKRCDRWYGNQFRHDYAADCAFFSHVSASL